MPALQFVESHEQLDEEFHRRLEEIERKKAQQAHKTTGDHAAVTQWLAMHSSWGAACLLSLVGLRQLVYGLVK
jgi:hypothetical protein